VNCHTHDLRRVPTSAAIRPALVLDRQDMPTNIYFFLGVQPKKHRWGCTLPAPSSV